MKKVLVALAMVMGLGSSVAFAYVVSGTQSVEQTFSRYSQRTSSNRQYLYEPGGQYAGAG